MTVTIIDPYRMVKFSEDTETPITEADITALNLPAIVKTLIWKHRNNS